MTSPYGQAKHQEEETHMHPATDELATEIPNALDVRPKAVPRHTPHIATCEADIDRSNNTRSARRAAAGFAAYVQANPSLRGEDAYTAFSDLFLDLFHLASACGIDAGEIVHRAETGYEEETSGDGDRRAYRIRCE